MSEPTVTTARARLTFLDLTKGFLVIVMVVYHCLNYTSEYQISFRYLSFLPPSFILVTGFILSHIYVRRYNPTDKSLTCRLVSRGGKLLLLFTLLNVMAQYMRSPVYGHDVAISALFSNWEETFLIGSGRTAVFEVLLPIGYLLVLSPWLLRLSHHRPGLLLLVAAFLVALCALLDYYGESVLNLNLISAGLVGMVIGQQLIVPTILGRFTWLALLAYCLYFPFGRQIGYVYVVQLIGACSALALFASLSVRMAADTWWEGRILRLGQYSLLAYVAQIAVLQLTSRLIGRPDPVSWLAASSLVFTFVSTSVIVEATHWTIHRFTGADKLYRAVFA
jgi:hypothetical protein